MSGTERTAADSPLLSATQLWRERQQWTVLEVSQGSAVASPSVMPQGHLPGARFIDLQHEFHDPAGRYPYTRPSVQLFEASASRAGLRNDQSIVIYDRANGIWAARLWWLLKAFGHQHVRVLDGGLAWWYASGLPLQDEPPSFAHTQYRACEQPSYFVDQTDVVSLLQGKADVQLVNVLRRPVFLGQENNYQRPGHIPGSLNYPYRDLIDPASNRLWDLPRLRTLLAPLLTSPNPVITYCGSGITAAGTALALTVLGKRNVAIYDGSLCEWTANPDLPLHTAP